WLPSLRSAGEGSSLFFLRPLLFREGVGVGLAEESRAMSEGRILVIEDDPKMQRLLNTQLKMRGYEVYAATDGETALLAAAEAEPDLILLDIGLPDLDGLEVCRRVREWSSVPIILVTAADTPQSKITALELGGDDYLVKPFHIGELV